MSRISSHKTLDALLQKLIAPQAATRRTAAKMLRKLKIKATGPGVLSALQWEMKDPKASETQYQMIMALGECGYGEALPFLRGLAKSEHPALVGVALGDAIVRLSREHEHDAAPVLGFLNGHYRGQIEGAFRAMAMLHLVPGPEAVATIIDFADHLSLDDALRFWVSAAAAGWDGPRVRAFLEGCRRSTREDLRKSAEASAAKKYLKWAAP